MQPAPQNLAQPPMQPQAAPGGAPPPQGGEVMQLPPEVARHIDPNNAIQMLLLQRVDKLTEKDGAVLQGGISPQAAAVLKKIIPEVGFMIDMIHSGGMDGGAAPGAAPAPAPGQPMPGPAPQGMPQQPPPRSRLAQI